MYFCACESHYNNTDVMVYKSTSLADTQTAARSFADELEPGAVVRLSGDLGAGKTTFIAACIAALGVEDVVTSPTFSVANIYEQPVTGTPIVHCDFYRLEKLTDFLNTGVYEMMEDAVSFVEWGEKIDQLAYTHHINIELSATGDRTIQIEKL